jgi:hypothetical protein
MSEMGCFFGIAAAERGFPTCAAGGILSRRRVQRQRLPLAARIGNPRSILLRAILLVLLSFASAASAQDNVDDALKRATQFLLQSQDPASGAINNKDERDGRVLTKRRNETAMTSLAILSLASMGHQPGDSTPEGTAIRKALAFVVRPEAQDKDGYFGDADGSRMYGHGITTLMLAEMLGMGADAAQDALIREKCRRAIGLILSAQKVRKKDSERGGWRYTPDQTDSDMSVTVWQVMALRSAKNAGMDVPKEAIDDAVGYIKRLYSPGDAAQPAVFGGFGYTGPSRETSTTAEGLLALQVCGQYDAPEVLGAAAKLLRDGMDRKERWFYYTTYYYAQGMYQRGGNFAEQGRRVVADVLLSRQSREGWWEGEGGEERQGGKIYATSMAVLSLAVKNHFLPIYQR